MNKVIVQVGGRGTGKTVLTKDMVKASPLPKTLILENIWADNWKDLGHDLDDSGSSIKVGQIKKEDLPRWRQGVYIYLWSLKSDAFEVMKELLYNTFCVVEDGRKLFDYRSRMSEEVLAFLINTKQRNNNLLINFHSLQQVPSELLDYVDYLIIGKSGTSAKLSNYTKNKYPDSVIEAHEKAWAHPDRFHKEEVDLRA